MAPCKLRLLTALSSLIATIYAQSSSDSCYWTSTVIYGADSTMQTFSSMNPPPLSSISPTTSSVASSNSGAASSGTIITLASSSSGSSTTSITSPSPLPAFVIQAFDTRTKAKRAVRYAVVGQESYIFLSEDESRTAVFSIADGGFLISQNLYAGPHYACDGCAIPLQLQEDVPPRTYEWAIVDGRLSYGDAKFCSGPEEGLAAFYVVFGDGTVNGCVPLALAAEPVSTTAWSSSTTMPTGMASSDSSSNDASPTSVSSTSTLSSVSLPSIITSLQPNSLSSHSIAASSSPASPPASSSSQAITPSVTNSSSSSANAMASSATTRLSSSSSSMMSPVTSVSRSSSPSGSVSQLVSSTSIMSSSMASSSVSRPPSSTSALSSIAVATSSTSPVSTSRSSSATTSASVASASASPPPSSSLSSSSPALSPSSASSSTALSSSTTTLPSSISTPTSTATSTSSSLTSSTTTSTTSSSSSPSATPNILTGKRGLAYSNVNQTYYYPPPTQVSWAYNYYYFPNSSSSRGIFPRTPSYPLRFIPLLFNDDPSLAVNWANAVPNNIANYGTDAIFSFNEPDLCVSGSACMTVPRALISYNKSIQPFAGQTRLVAPAVTNAGSGFDWLRDFLGNASLPQWNLTIDIVNIHWYASPYNMQYFIEYMVNASIIAAGRPIWITEYGMDNNNYAEAAVQQFIRNTTYWCDQQPFIERYAWFGNYANNLLNSGGTALSSRGQLYDTYNGTGYVYGFTAPTGPRLAGSVSEAKEMRELEVHPEEVRAKAAGEDESEWARGRWVEKMWWKNDGHMEGKRFDYESLG